MCIRDSPFSEPSAAAFIAALISSLVAGVFSWTVRSVAEPVGRGTRIEKPSSLPLSWGMTRAIALAAPVVVGIMFRAAARARRTVSYTHLRAHETVLDLVCRL